MKISRSSRFITSSISTKYLTDDILFDDVIRVKVEIRSPQLKNLIASAKQFNKFPGKEQFREDVIKLLEEKYFFDVIEDVYDGKLQKGYFSNRSDSLSLYLDTYLDLNKLQKLSSDIRAKHLEGKMYCFIHIRFSDHILADAGDVLHNKFIDENARKYSDEQVTHVMKDEEIELDKYDINYYYDDALDDLDAAVESKISYWIRRADHYLKRNQL